MSTQRRLAVLVAGPLAIATVCVLAGCGGAARPIVVSVVSAQQREPVANALVRVAGTTARGTTNAAGDADFSLKLGHYEIATSARGYYEVETRSVLRPGDTIGVQLTYRPPDGTLVWNIGPNGEFWVIATVTSSTIRSTEYDWTCGGRDGGGWQTFPGPLPEAIAPGVPGPEWVRERFSADAPPRPPAWVCSRASASRPPGQRQMPWWA